MKIKLLPSLKFWIFPALASLILTVIYLSRSFAVGQGIPAVDPYITYQNCEASAHTSNLPIASCQTTLPREAEYTECLNQTPSQPGQDSKTCDESYINNIVSDSLNNCLQNHSQNITDCQEFYGPNSIFANCFRSSKNLTVCDNIYGLK